MCIRKLYLIQGILRKPLQAFHQGLPLLQQPIITSDQALHTFADFFDRFFRFCFSSGSDDSGVFIRLLFQLFRILLSLFSGAFR